MTRERKGVILSVMRRIYDRGGESGKKIKAISYELSATSC